MKTSVHSQGQENQVCQLCHTELPPCRSGALALPRRLRDSRKHVLITDVEIVTDGGRRRGWPAAENLQIVE